MIDYSLLKNMLIVAMSSGIITAALVQKIKESINSKTLIIYISFILSFTVGFLFSITFTELSIIHSVWVGILSFIGADTLYQMFEDKIFTSFKELKKEEYIEIERDD